ncbi:hypothetical protein MBANPS3_011063 [Mucor bainieri]
MKPRRKPQRVLVIIKKADALSNTKQRLTGNKGVPHHRTARHYSPLNVKKEEDDYKDALNNTLKAASDEENATGVSATRVKTEIKQEEEMAKATLHSSSESDQELPLILKIQITIAAPVNVSTQAKVYIEFI